MWGMKNMYTTFVGKPEGRSYSEDKFVDGRIILKWILGKYGWEVWIGFIWLRIGTGGRLLRTWY
jgi:hypothetical protein